jgi:ABC-type nitrate/sulfonate/bicarbonate transport system substrate-binding protein
MGVLRRPLKLTGIPTFIFSPHGRGNRITTSRTARVIVAAIISVIVMAIGTYAQAEKIRTAIPQANLNYLSIYVADGRGFFKDEGLDNETVVISGPLATAALLSGDVDYSGGGGSGMRAAIKGAPIKGIYFQSEKVTFYLVAEPSIKSAADLKGKRVAVGSSGDTQDRMITMFVERGGVSSREIVRISVGSDTATRILAIKSGNAHATTVDPGGLVFAQKEGLVSLGFLGDLFPMPFQGFVATDRKIRDNPAQVKRWLKAAIRGLMFVRDRPEEAVELGMKKLQLGRATKAMIVEGTKNYVRALPQGVPGMPSAEGIKNFLEYDIKVPLGLKEDIPLERLLHLQLVKEVKEELEIAQRRTK